MMKNKTNSDSLKWILKNSKSAIFPVIITCVFSAINSVSTVYLALVSRDVIDIATKAKTGNLINTVFLLFGVIAIHFGAMFVASIIKNKTHIDLCVNYKRTLFPLILRKNYAKISSFHSGDLVNRLVSDVDAVVSGSVNIVPTIVSMVSKIISCIIALYLLNPFIALAVLPVGALIYIGNRAFRTRFKELHKECQRTDSKVRSFMQESFENLSVIKSFLSGNGIVNRLEENMQENRKLKLKRSLLRVSVMIIISVVFSLCYYLTLTWGAANLNTAITYGTLMGLLQLITNIRAPLQSATGIIPSYYAALASAERLMELEAIEDEKEPKSTKQINKIKKSFEKIVALNLDFSYKDNHVIKDSSFEINRGTITALVGESGSGKSTLFKLLLGLLNADYGSLTFDENVEIDASTRPLFAYVPQGNMLISGTIRDNVTFCRDGVSDEDVVSAVKMAAAFDFISELPDGLDTVISERGSGLSEGQIQRIAIARAVLSDSEILLLDESTSAVDEETEAKLVENLKTLKDKTVIFITHRSSSLKACEHVIRVQDGRIFNEK